MDISYLARRIHYSGKEVEDEYSAAYLLDARLDEHSYVSGAVEKASERTDRLAEVVAQIIDCLVIRGLLHDEEVGKILNSTDYTIIKVQREV